MTPAAWMTRPSCTHVSWFSLIVVETSVKARLSAGMTTSAAFLMAGTSSLLNHVMTGWAAVTKLAHTVFAVCTIFGRLTWTHVTILLKNGMTVLFTHGSSRLPIRMSRDWKLDLSLSHWTATVFWVCSQAEPKVLVALFSAGIFELYRSNSL